MAKNAPSTKQNITDCALPNDRHYVDVIGAVTFGKRFNYGYSASITTSGIFTQTARDDHKAYSDAVKALNAGDKDALIKSSHTRAYPSHGFGYTEETVQAMQNAGFTIDPCVAFSIGGLVGAFNYNVGAQEIIKHPLYEMKEHFESLGINCFFAEGGHFVDKADSVALIFDTTDPDFFTKIKPDFMAYFPTHQASELSNPAHINTHKLEMGYALSIFMALKTYGEKIGATYEHNLFTSDTPSTSTELMDKTIPQRANSQAHAKLQFVFGAFDAMLPVLSAEERGQVITQLVSKLVGLDDNIPNTNLQLLPAGNTIKFSP